MLASTICPRELAKIESVVPSLLYPIQLACPEAPCRNHMMIQVHARIDTIPSECMVVNNRGVRIKLGLFSGWNRC